MKKYLIALLFLLSPCIARGQSQVSIALGGTYANGTVVVTTINPNGNAAPVRSTFLDTNGAASLSWLPTGAKNVVTACKSDNTGCLGTTVQPTGAVQDITAALQANPVGGGAGGSFGPNYSIGGGTAQAQTVAPTTAITNALLVTGYQICWLPNAANSGAAPTLAGSGSSTFSAKPITKYGTVALVANDIVTTAVACATYDGTEFQLQMPIAGNIARTSYQAVGASAQEMDLYTNGGCDGISACTGFKWALLAPSGLGASLVYTGNSTDGSGNSAFVTNGSQALSTVQLPQYIAGAGSVNVMTATYVPAFSAYAAGEEFDVLPNLANTTTTPTLNVNGLGAKTITRNGTQPLVAGDYTTTAVAKFIYDGTGMQLQNPQSQIVMAGATSGFATMTPPAVAGTRTNAVTMTNTLLGPVGGTATPTYAVGVATTGLYSSAGGGGDNATLTATGQSGAGTGVRGSGDWFIGLPGTYFGADMSVASGTQAFKLAQNNIFAWSAQPADASAAADTGISRDAVDIIDFGNGGAADASAFTRSGNTVRLTSNFTTASTSLVTITGLSWTFPATNHNYNFNCRLSYSQATAAAANAFGVQSATTAPTNLYAAMAVSTGLAITGVDATLPLLSTTTATNIGTFTPSAAGAIGTVADIFTAEIWGSLEQGAGATTLNIMTLTGSASDSLTIYRGSYCSLLP